MKITEEKVLKFVAYVAVIGAAIVAFYVVLHM
jgi:hypothetical protein